MIDSKKILAITLARGGSKSIYKKNIALLNGKPLIAYTIEAAKNSKLIDEYIVSTDDQEIADIAQKLGAKIPFLRPKELADDSSSSADAIVDAVKKYEKKLNIEFDYIIELMCTNPFKDGKLIDDVLRKLHSEEDADAVITVEQILDHHPSRVKKIENGFLKDFCIPEIYESRRQDLSPKAYVRNGNIYAMRRNLIIKNNLRYNSHSCKPFIADLKSINIDEPQDFIVAENLLKIE